MSVQDIPVVTGPTASGKGAVAFELARLLGGEIVSMDSMKVYREMDVATAKPPAARRSTVRHHLMDIIDPHEDFSLGQYLILLEKALGEIRSRGSPAILCGGTPLYLKAYLHGLEQGPAADWSLRSVLIEEAASRGPQALYERLRQVDPAAAAKIHSTDLRRIVRALEVQAKTGRPLSEGWKWGTSGSGKRDGRVFGLAWEREELYRRIDRRVERMVEGGLFEEAIRLRDRRPPLSRSASQSIGYKEICEGLRSGCSREEIVRRIQQNTRRFAKRQLTWLRKLPVEWLSPGGEPDAASLARQILERL